MRPFEGAALAAILLGLAACGSTAPKTERPASRDDSVSGATAGGCNVVADCEGKPARPNVEMCMHGSSVQLQCRDHVCLYACAPRP